jgi:hypothetical protein
MADDQREQPAAHTPKGYKVPAPKRRDFFGSRKKIAQPLPNQRAATVPQHTRRPPTPRGSAKGK